MRSLLALGLLVAARSVYAQSDDCNGNGYSDLGDIIVGWSLDCNYNGIPDECDLASRASADANGNGVPDECDLDCDGNGVSDDLDLAAGTHADCNENQVPDRCDIASGVSVDIDGNGVPDRCQPDCNSNAIPDSHDITLGTSADEKENGIPDECDAAPRFLVIDLGTTAGLSSWGMAINDRGEIAGDSLFCCLAEPGTGTASVGRAFLWRRNRMFDLGTPEVGSPGCRNEFCEVEATEINDCAEIAASSEGFDGQMPVVWLPHDRGNLTAGYNVLPLPAPFGTGVAEAINNAGSIVGFGGSLGGGRALLWEFNGLEYGVRDIGSLAPGQQGHAIAADINDLGQVVGTSRSADSGELEGFLWLPEPAYGLSAGMHRITPGLDSDGRAAVAINNRGQVVGGFGIKPWLWLPEPDQGLPTGLSLIRAPAFGVFPSDINDAGQILGTALVPSIRVGGRSQVRAVLRHEGTWFVLDTLLKDGEAWDLRNFSINGGGLNSRGLVTGDGLNFEITDANGFRPATHGYLLIPTGGGRGQADGYRPSRGLGPRVPDCRSVPPGPR